MWSQFSGKGLMVFSDPAGAKACLSLNEILKLENVEGERKLFSNKSYPFYRQFTGKVELIDNTQIKSICQHIEQPDWIFTGTSHPDSSGGFELKFLQGITAKSFSFIDHWTNFKLRFELDDELVLPDTIFVLDIKAAEMAVADGLPAEKIALLDSPVIYYLRNYHSVAISKSSFCKKLDIPMDRKIVLYVPDPISLRSNSSKNEFMVLEELADLCENNYTLLLKIHPLQPVEVINKLLEKRPDVIIVSDTEFMPADIFKNVDCIVGFYSNILLEANTIQSNIITYSVNQGDPQYLHHVLRSVSVSNKNELNFALKSACA